MQTFCAAYGKQMHRISSFISVSYTHLDVYKRQNERILEDESKYRGKDFYGLCSNAASVLWDTIGKCFGEHACGNNCPDDIGI